MKKLLFVLMLLPFVSIAQKPLPRYENDTLYTSSGYKIYIGQVLHFGIGSGSGGKFKYVNIKNDIPYNALKNNSVTVKEMMNYGISILGNAYIEIIGSIVFKDGTKGGVDIHMAFDRAIEYSGKSPGELLVPDEFKFKLKGSVAEEINKFYELYQEGIITKEEFEAQKKKLLDKQ
jgi:Short C-terminal domain